jgi:hypothetical protein
MDRRGGGAVVELGLCEAGEIGFAAMMVARSLGAILPETRRTCGGDMSPEDFVRIELGSIDGAAGRRRHFADPALAWPLHTDRTLHDDPGDFLLVAKAAEEGAPGGRIRLLHLDEFSRLEEFAGDPLAETALEWKGDALLAPLHEQAQLRKLAGVMAPVFERGCEGWQIRFTDIRFRQPKSADHGAYLRKLDEALSQEAESLAGFHLPVGGMYLVNNRFWLHGREGFRVEGSGFYRQILRFCGNVVN